MTEPLPPGPYKVICADPPWRFISWSRQPALVMNARSPEKHYPVMTMAEILAMPVRDVVDDNCHLFLWATGPCLPHALRVMAAWGFVYSGMGFVWVKLRKRASDADVERLVSLEELPSLLHTGLGLTTRKNAEFVLLGRRGKPARLAKNVREIILAARREHSRKPDIAYTEIARYADGPRLEMFATTERPGWDHWAPMAHVWRPATNHLVDGIPPEDVAAAVGAPSI